MAVISRSLDLDYSGQVFSAADAHARTLIITCAKADPERLAAAKQAATVVIAGEDRVDPAEAMAALAGLGFEVVLCEGGPRWLGELVAADRLDELCLSISPMMGGDPLPVTVVPSGAGVSQFGLKSTMVDGDTLFLRYESTPPDERP